MGGDRYSFIGLYSSDNAIMVTNKDILATRRSASSKEVVNEYAHSLYDEEEDFLNAYLDKAVVDWLLDRAQGYNAYQIGGSFVLFTKAPNELRKTPYLDVTSPYEIEPGDRCVSFSIEKAPKGDDYTELFELASKFTPSGSKLSFAPGMYSFSTTDCYWLDMEQLKRSNSSSVSSSDGTSKKISAAKGDIDAPPSIPFDFELIVGSGDEKKTIGVNRASFLCYFPHVETYFGDSLMDGKLELPELDPQAVQTVLAAFSSRKTVYKPYRAAFEEVQLAFGKSMLEMVDQKEPPTKRPRLEHPAMADPRWLDASFLCGPQREEIKVNRSVLASMNPVLHRILYGTGLISVDPSTPIEWPDFDAQAVRQVFLALVHCCKKEFVVPMESVESAKMLVDYLLETREALMLYYDTPFKREYEGKFVLYQLRNGDGLKFLK